MTEQLAIFPDEEDRRGRTRENDWKTSTAGAKAVVYRAGTQKTRLLAAYHSLPDATDEEAAKKAGISLLACYWKRAGELRQDGYIAPLLNEDGEIITRKGNAGTQRIVCQITPAGERLHRLLMAPPTLF